MKKKIGIILGIILIIGAFTLLIYACIASGSKQNAMDDKLIKINFSELEKKVNNKETFFFVITQTQCSHCAEYKPVLKEVLYEYDITAYELDEATLTKEEIGKLKDIANISGTPTTIFIENGTEKSTTSRIKGAAKKQDIISRLKAMGYIENNN